MADQESSAKEGRLSYERMSERSVSESRHMLYRTEENLMSKENAFPEAAAVFKA